MGRLPPTNFGKNLKNWPKYHFQKNVSKKILLETRGGLALTHPIQDYAKSGLNIGFKSVSNKRSIFECTYRLLNVFFKNIGLNLIFQILSGCLEVNRPPSFAQKFFHIFLENGVVGFSNFSRYHLNQPIFASFWCIKFDFFQKFWRTFFCQPKMAKFLVGTKFVISLQKPIYVW